MKNTHGEKVLVLALIACLSACADPVTGTTEPAMSRDVRTEPGPASTVERAALTRIARLVAVAVDNEQARQRLKRDLRAAPFHEHKLQLANYLQSKAGRVLLDRMVASNGGNERDVLKTLATIRPLEFYMPVTRHRESWTGGADVLVVSQLDEWEPIVAFNEKGREVALDRNAAPEQPTLSIVPVETRFDQPMAPAASRNVGDQNGNAIGTLQRMAPKGSSLIACGDECGGGGGGGSPPPSVTPGLYLEFSRIVDMKEPWFRGKPEVEVHIQGPRDSGSPTSGEDLSCSGEHAYEFQKVFNQDDGFWQGRVMLFSQSETAAFVQKFNQGFHVLFWEDDNDPCVLKLDTNSMVALMQSTFTAASTVALKVLPQASWKVVAGAFIASFFANAGEWLLTNDDFLGVAVDQASAGYFYPGNTHVIMNGVTLNGRATIVYRQ